MNNDIACLQLKNNDGEFLMPLKVVLKCLKLAIDENKLPELQKDWWLDVQDRYLKNKEKHYSD